MADWELVRSNDMSGEGVPITAVVIVADKNKCPPGFTPLTKTYDEGADADLWRESSFSLWSRPVRYIAVSRELRADKHVLTDMTVVRDTEPVPHGYVAIDYAADSREKALRKRFLCIKTESRDTCVDAVTEVIIINKSKRIPKNFSSAGEIDGCLLCFKASVIPSNYGLRQTQSEQNIQTPGLVDNRIPYPELDHNAHSSSSLDKLKGTGTGTNAFTIKGGGVPVASRGVEGVKFVLNPRLQSALSNQISSLPTLPERPNVLDALSYNFQLEQATIIN